MHIDLGLRVMESLYTMQEVKAFMDEVLDEIGSMEPESRARILRRLAEKRTLRAAFLPHK